MEKNAFEPIEIEVIALEEDVICSSGETANFRLMTGCTGDDEIWTD